MSDQVPAIESDPEFALIEDWLLIDVPENVAPAAALIALITALDLGASDRWMVACARLILASGRPTNSTAWAAATAACRAVGSASPTSSLAWTMSRRAMNRGSSPASIILAR